MKLSYLDKFADWLLNRPIVELASERNEKMIKIQEISKPLNEHLFKIYLMPDSSYEKHWKDEVDNFLNIVNDKHWGKKKYEERDYFEWLFVNYFFESSNDYYIGLKEYKGNLNRLLNNISEKYPDEKKIKWNLEEFINMCERFYTFICKELEKLKYGYTTLDIDSLLDQYFKF